MEMQPCLSSGVNLLVQDGIPCRDQLAIKESCANGHLEIVLLLLSDSRVDPSAGDNYAICIAAAKGFVEIVRTWLLDPRVNPFVNDYIALCMAAWNGHLEVVRALLADFRIDPIVAKDRASKYALQSGNKKMKVLLARRRETLKASFSWRK